MWLNKKNNLPNWQICTVDLSLARILECQSSTEPEHLQQKEKREMQYIKTLTSTSKCQLIHSVSPFNITLHFLTTSRGLLYLWAESWAFSRAACLRVSAASGAVRPVWTGLQSGVWPQPLGRPGSGSLAAVESFLAPTPAGPLNRAAPVYKTAPGTDLKLPLDCLRCYTQ